MQRNLYQALWGSRYKQRILLIYKRRSSYHLWGGDWKVWSSQLTGGLMSYRHISLKLFPIVEYRPLPNSDARSFLDFYHRPWSPCHIRSHGTLTLQGLHQLYLTSSWDLTVLIWCHHPQFGLHQMSHSWLVYDLSTKQSGFCSGGSASLYRSTFWYHCWSKYCCSKSVSWTLRGSSEESTISVFCMFDAILSMEWWVVYLLVFPDGVRYVSKTSLAF